MQIVVEKWHGAEPLPLGNGWALGADDLQWFVLRARNHRGRIKWQPVGFVCSTRDVLRRVLREKGVRLTPEGEAAVNALQPTFDAWRKAQRERIRSAAAE